MWQNRIMVFSLLIICTLTFVLSAQTPTKPCELAFKCSLEPPLAWATDGKFCKVYQNNCHLSSQNCQRANRNEPALTAVSQDECLKYCPRFCTREFNPVCASNNGVSTTFANPCIWTEKICETKDAHVFQFEGRCAE